MTSKDQPQGIFTALSPAQTDATFLANNFQHCWVLHVASVCTPCCMLLRFVGICCVRLHVAFYFLHGYLILPSLHFFFLRFILTDSFTLFSLRSRSPNALKCEMLSPRFNMSLFIILSIINVTSSTVNTNHPL